MTVQVEDGVDRALAGHLAEDVNDPLQILVVDGRLQALGEKMPEFGEAHQLPRLALDREPFEVRQRGALRHRQAQQDTERMAFAVDMHRPHPHAAQSDGQGFGDAGVIDPRQGRLLPVGDENEAALGIFHRVIHIPHLVFTGHAFPHQLGGRRLFGVGNPRLGIDLGGEGGDDRRPRRQFDDFEESAVIPGDARQIVAQAQGDGVALHIARAFVRQVDANVGDVRPLAQVIVAHQTVEIHGAGGADVGLKVGHLGDGGEIVLQRSHRRVGTLQGRPFGEIEHQLELVLVVEGEHLHRHQIEGRHRHGAEKQHQHAPHQQPGPPSRRQKGEEQAPVNPVGAGLFEYELLLFLAVLPFQHVVAHPRRDGEGDEQGHDHGQRQVDRHRPHVRPHHPGNEEHRQKGEDDRQGRQDHRWPHLVDGGEDGVPGRLLLHLEMAEDVLHIDDGVVDQQAQGEDQGEEGDAVDGVAEPVVDQQGQGIDDGDGDRDDQGLAPAEGEEDQAEDGDDGDDQMGNQLVDLVIGGLAVVAGDADLDAVGDDRPAHACHRVDHLLGDAHGVGPLLLGHRDMHCLILPAIGGGFGIPGRAETQPGVAARLGHAVFHPRHLPQVDRTSLVDADHQIGDLGGGLEEGTAAHQQFFVELLKTAGRQFQIGPGQGAPDFEQIETAPGQGQGIDLHPQLPGTAADDGRRRGLFHRLQAIDHLLGDPAQLVIGRAWRIEGEVDDRHVVHLHRLDHPAGDPRRNDVGVGGDLVVQLDQRLNAVLTDVKTHGDDGEIGSRHGIDVLDPVHLPEQFLQARGDLIFHLLGAGPGQVHVDVGQGDDDLRLLFAGSQEQGGGAGEDRQQDEDHRQVAVEEAVDDAGRQGVLFGAHPLLLHPGAVLRPSGAVDHQGFSRAQAGEDLHLLADNPAGPYQPVAQNALFHDIEAVELSAPDQRRRRNQKRRAAAVVGPHPGEESGWQGLIRRQLDLHLNGPARRIGGGDQLANTSRQLPPQGRNFHGEGATEGDPARQGLGQIGPGQSAPGAVEREQRGAGKDRPSLLDQQRNHHPGIGGRDLTVGEHDIGSVPRRSGPDNRRLRPRQLLAGFLQFGAHPVELLGGQGFTLEQPTIAGLGLFRQTQARVGGGRTALRPGQGRLGLAPPFRRPMIGDDGEQLAIFHPLTRPHHQPRHPPVETRGQGRAIGAFEGRHIGFRRRQGRNRRRRQGQSRDRLAGCGRTRLVAGPAAAEHQKHQQRTPVT